MEVTGSGTSTSERLLSQNDTLKWKFYIGFVIER